jgi:hypothetical protein
MCSRHQGTDTPLGPLFNIPARFRAETGKTDAGTKTEEHYSLEK